MLLTLSSITTIILHIIAQSRATSNAFPAGVSASKMISYRRFRQEELKDFSSGSVICFALKEWVR
jgi:hypothetical protein